MEEKAFVIHMRERTARGIWKIEHGQQNRPGYWWGQGEGAREEEKREEVKQVDQKRKKSQERKTKRPRELVEKGKRKEKLGEVKLEA